MKLAVDVRVKEGWRIAFECDSPRLALVGPNGSGKSTVLRALAGDPRVEAEVVFDAVSQQSVAPEHRAVGYAPQRARALPGLRVRDELAFGGGDPMALVNSFDLERLVERSSASLSGGELARLGVARSLSHQPKLVLLDEPFAAIDVRHCAALRLALSNALEELGAALVVATHSIADVFALACDVLVFEASSAPVFVPHADLRESGNAFIEAMRTEH